MYNSFAIVFIPVIYLLSASSLWAWPSIRNTKHHLKLAVGVSWSSAGLQTGNQTYSTLGLVDLVLRNQTRDVAPIETALGWPRTGLWAEPATASLPNTPFGSLTTDSNHRYAVLFNIRGTIYY